MSEKKGKNIFLIGYVVLMVIMLMMSSCGINDLTQKQVEIDYKLNKLYLDYSYERDSLINEFYKK